MRHDGGMLSALHRSFHRFVSRFSSAVRAGCRLMVLCLLTAPVVCQGQIGTFQSDFNSGLPQYAYAHGNAAATGSSSTSDQRGYGMSGVPDIGAYEAGHDADFSLWATENSASFVPLAAAGDEDGDGQPNLAEYAFRTDPRSPGSFGKLTQALDGSISFPVRQPGDINLQYQLETSSDLQQWSTAATFQIVPAGQELTTTGGVSGNFNKLAGTFAFSFSQTRLAPDRHFWRVDVS